MIVKSLMRGQYLKIKIKVQPSPSLLKITNSQIILKIKYFFAVLFHSKKKKKKKKKKKSLTDKGKGP